MRRLRIWGLLLLAGNAWAASPQRIVSLNLCTDQILLQLVPHERIAALSLLSKNPESAALHREAQGLRTVNGNAEEVLALQPDLVLVGSVTTRHTTRLLREFGIAVLALPGAESFSQVRAQIRTVAQAVGESARGEAVISAMELRERELAGVSAARKGTATPYWSGGRSAGANTLYSDILHAGGYVSGGAKAGLQGYGALPLERLVALTPDVLLSNDYKRGVATLGNRLLQHPALAGLGAKHLTLPSRLTVCGGPWNLDASALLAQGGGAL
ncbi:MAG: ABC transporter substrate-binding protein [Rhodoferax sp.]|nr:ABC transporter substrate-binding protein [Rhodoferax sp.]MDP3652922.1 ABC transporter substrate-binding protein [Rhodoferax sp.]